MKDFLTDEEMQKLEANETPDFISDEEMAKIEGPAVEPVTMVENEPTPIADMAVALNRGIESAGEAIASPIRRLFTAPPNQDVVVPEELDLGSMQAVRDRQAMLPPSMPAEPGYVPPAGITEGLEAALPIAYQATKKGISGAIEAAAENIPVTSFPTAPIAEYMQGVGEGAQAEIEKIMQEKQIRPGTISGVATDVGATVLQFAPILGASIISPTLAPYGLGLLATISGGDKYQKAKQAGFTEEQALAQGIAYGIAEVVGEKIGLDALLNAYKNPALRQGIMGFIKETAKQAGIGAGEEGLTQIMQNSVDIAAKKFNPYTAGQTPNLTQDVLYSAGVGAIGQGLVGGGLGALQSMMGGQQQPQTEAPKEEVQPEEPTATEPPPQNMEATTEFLTRKPAVTFGEAERLRGEEVPTGGMTINRRARPTVTLGGEGERIVKAIPEGEKKDKTITARPITEIGLKEDTELPPNVWLHGSKYESGPIDNFTVATDSGTMYLTKNWDTARNYAGQRPENIKAVELNSKAKIFDLNNDVQAEELAKIIRENNEDYSEMTGKELQKMNFVEAGLSDNREIGNILYDANVDAVLDTKGNADIINDNALKTYNPKGMTVQPTAPTNKLDQLFKREASRLDNYVKDFAPRDKTRIKNQLQTIDKIADEYGNIEILYDEKAKPQYKLSTKDGKEYRRINKTEYEYLKSIGKEAIEAKKPLQFSDLENMSDEEILAIPERELEKVARAESVPFRDRVDFNIRLNKIKPSTPSPQPQQATEVAPKDITPQPVSKTPAKPLEVIEKEIEDLKFKLNRNRNISAKQLMEAKTNISIFQDDIGDALRKNKDTSFASKQWEEIKSKYSPETLEEAEKQKFAVKEEEKMAINRKIAAEYQRKIDEQKLQSAEQTAVKTPETDIKNFYKYNEESQNNIMSAQQFESASIERSDGNPAIKTIIYRWEPKPNGNGGKLLKDVFLDNKKESSEIYNEYENKIDAVKDAYNNISTNRSDRKSFFIDKDVKKYDTEVQTTKTKNERRAKITEQVQSEVDNKVQEIEQIKNDLNTKYHTELAREYKAAGILFEKVKPSKYRKTFKGQIQPIVTKENQKQIKEISSRIMDKIKKENKVAFDEITNFKADDYKNKLIEERMALSEGKPVPPEVLAEYPYLQPRPKTGPGMFGGATVQNAYEKVEPTLKKGADLLFKKGKQAYETVKRNADLTRDVGRVIDITEKEGRPVETEPPIRPRIGLFNLQNVYDAVFGKPKTSDDRITVGDPTIGKKINDMYDRTNKAEVKMKQEAESKRQTIGGAARQSLIDLFAPYLDIAKKDSATYEKALASLHDVFYIPSSVEAFLNNYRDQILSPIKKANKTYRDYSAYRMAKWTLTGRAKVKSPLSLKEAQDFVDSIDPQTRKLFEDITTDFHEKTWKPLLQEIEDSGLKDDKVIKFIMDKENYATFFPAKQMGLSYGSREYKPSGEIFKLTEEGFQGDIQDVLTSLMQKGIAMLTHANINMAKLTGIDILKTMSPKDITPAKQSFKGYRKVKDTNGNEIEMPIMEFDEPAPNSQMALLTVRENGKAKGYYVPKQFAEAFDNALGDPSSFADSLHYYSNLTQAIKNVWIDYNPPWQLFTNMVRDIPAAAIEMPGFKKPVKFLGKVIKKAPAAIGDYVKFVGEVGQQITGYDRKAFEKQVTQLLKEKKLLSSKDVQHLGDYNITVFDRIQNAFDTFPKEGESQGFLQQLKAFGKDVERLTKVAFDETLQESGEFTQDEIKNMTRRGGSPAFGVRGGGKAFEVIKVPLMFYNAVKEGWRAGKYFYQKDPVGFLIKASVPLSIFSFGAAAATGAFGDEWKKAYLAIKKSDRENKLVYPLWWTDEGNIKYLALSVPQFLKPFMIMINELASSNPSLAEGLADAMSNEMPSLNPVLDITKTLTSYGGNKPPIDRFGNPIMTQDQWTAGGSEKAIAMLKSISNQNLFGSYFKFPIKPSDKRKDWLETFYDASFGKIMKESYAPSIDTEEEDVNAAKARLLARQAIEAEESDPAEAERLREEMRKLGYTPSRQFMRSVRREMNIEREKKAGTITEKEAYEKRLRQQPKVKRKKYNELFRK